MFVKKSAYFILIIGLMLLSGCSGTANPDFQTVLQNLSGSFPGIWRLLTATAYVLGFFFAFKAIYTLKVYGESRTMMSSHASIKGPILNLLAATMLIFIPTGYDMINFTIFRQTGILNYNQGGIGSLSQDSVMIIQGIVQIVGLIAFIRGWILLAKSGDQGSQPILGKAFTHIIGGVLGINIALVQQMISNTLGFR